MMKNNKKGAKATRRTKGVYKTEDGTWRARNTINTVRFSKNFKTKTAAMNWLRTINEGVFRILG